VRGDVWGVHARAWSARVIGAGHAGVASADQFQRSCRVTRASIGRAAGRGSAAGCSSDTSFGSALTEDSPGPDARRHNAFIGHDHSRTAAIADSGCASEYDANAVECDADIFRERPDTVRERKAFRTSEPNGTLAVGERTCRRAIGEHSRASAIDKRICATANECGPYSVTQACRSDERHRIAATASKPSHDVAERAHGLEAIGRPIGTAAGRRDEAAAFTSEK
jgi:hypothetical protein